MRKPDCFLCGDLADRDGRIALGGGLALTSDVAPLVPGHLLIHTDDHVGSFAAAAPETLMQWKAAIRGVLNLGMLEKQPVLVFEHGTNGVDPTEAGCTDHAHIHVVPVSLDAAGFPITSAAQAIARLDDGRPGAVLPFEQLGKLNGTNYFWLADRDLNLRTVMPDRIERQVLRRIVANALGLSEHRTWDLLDENGSRETMENWRQIESELANLVGGPA